MATCREIITSALRKPNLIAMGEAPAAEDAAEALTILQSLYDEMVALGSFGRLAEVIITADYEAGENERIYNNGAVTYSVTLPETIDDAAAENGVRPPRDCALVAVVGASPAAYIYTASRGAWDDMSGLGLSSYAPLSDRSRDGLAALLAVRVCEANGRSVPQVVANTASAFRRLVTQRNNSPRSETMGTYF